LGNLDRVGAWLRVFGMVNSAPGFDRQPNVVNGFSDLILEIYGSERRIKPARRSAWRGCLWGYPSRSRQRWNYLVASDNHPPRIGGLDP
jgi:hypothetical protein